MLAAISRLYRDAFSGLERPVWLLAFVGLINRAGSMVFPFLSLYITRDLGFGAGAASAVLLAFGLGSVAGSYVGGRLSTRIGSLRTMELSLLSSGVGYALLGLADGIALLAVGSFVVSGLADAFRPACMTAISEHASEATRTRGFTLLRLAVNLGMAVGPAVGGWLALHDYRLLFFVDGATCFLAGVAAWALLGRTARAAGLATDSTKQRPVRRASRDPRFLLFLFLVFCLGMAFFQVFCTLPLLLHDAYGLPENAIGALIGLNAALIVLFEMPLVRSLERRSQLRLYGLGSLLICLGLAAMPFGDGLLFALCTVVIWSIGEMVALPFSNALVASRAGRGAGGEYMGLYSMTFSACFLLAPVVGLWTYEHLGAVPLFGGIGVVGVAVFATCQLLPVGWLSRSANDG